MVMRWNTPKDRVRSRLEDVRKELSALRFTIPDSVVHGVPDDPRAHAVVDAVVQLQRQIYDLTSEESIHGTFSRYFRNLDNSTRGFWGVRNPHFPADPAARSVRQHPA